MAGTSLNFTWKEHGHRTVTQLSSQFGRPDYSDAKFFCKGRLIPVHKLVLIAASPYFEKLFAELPSGDHPVIVIRDADPQVVELVLTYVYSGYANVPSEVAEAFLNLALDFQIRGLESKAQETLRNRIHKLVQENGLVTNNAGASGVARQDLPRATRNRAEETKQAAEAKKRKNFETVPDNSKSSRRESAGLSLASPVGLGWEDRAEGGLFGASDQQTPAPAVEKLRSNEPGLRSSSRTYPSIVRASQNGPSQPEVARQLPSRSRRRSAKDQPQLDYSIVGTDASAVLGSSSTPTATLPPKITLRRGGGATWAINNDRSHPSTSRVNGTHRIPRIPKAVVVLKRLKLVRGVKTIRASAFFAHNGVADDDDAMSADEVDAHPNRVPKLIDRTRTIVHENETMWKGFTSNGQPIYFCGNCDFKGFSMTTEAYNHVC